MSVAVGSTPTPFKGLAPFQDTELDAQLFCGRDREREVLVANLLASRLDSVGEDVVAPGWLGSGCRFRCCASDDGLR